MRIRIDPRSHLPGSQQLVARLRSAIERGSLKPGERLLPVRRLAEDLGLAPNTVAKAYRTLEAEGLLVGRGRQGTFVTDPPPQGDLARYLDDAAGDYVDRARRGGATDRQALDAVRRRIGPR
jgi:DNA-binding transcriptional regulator YhcF (GntR family)